MVLTDGVIGQAMEPVVLTYRNPAAARGWSRRGGRPAAARRRSLYLHPEDLERTTATSRRSTARSRSARSAGPATLDDADLGRRLRHRGPHRPDGGRAGPGGGMAVGLFRPITLWPFPTEELRRVAARARASCRRASAGQMVEDVRLAVTARRPCASTAGRADGADTGRGHRRVGRAWATTDPRPSEADGAAMTQRPSADPSASTAPTGRVYRRPDLLTDRSTHYCPGCGHGIVHRLSRS